MSLPKPLCLWFCTRKTNSVLSGQKMLTKDVQREVFEMTGLKITQDDIDKFPKILLKYSKYLGEIYRGVCSTDDVYVELMKSGETATNRYYSCTSEKYIGKLFGDKILLVISNSSNFDVRHVSREKEIILNKNITLKLISCVLENEYTVLKIDCCEN